MPTRPRVSPIQALLPLPPRDYLILFALVDGARHGHGILKAIESGSGGVPCDPANLYRSLSKLEREGLVVEASGPPGSGGPPRRLYRLTRLGRSVLGAEADRLATLAEAARARNLLSWPQTTR